MLSVDGTRIRDANPVLCALLGHATGALAGHPVSELVGGAGLADGIHPWRHGAGGTVEVRVRRSGPGGGTLVVEGVDADEAARSAENRHDLAAAGLGEWRWERATRRLVLSRRAAQILGHPPARPRPGRICGPASPRASPNGSAPWSRTRSRGTGPSASNRA